MLSRFTFSDAFVLSLLTAYVYLIAVSYQAAYQGEFGFINLSIGLENVVNTIRILGPPVVGGLTGVLLLVTLVRLTFARIPEHGIVTSLVVAFPILLLGLALITNANALSSSAPPAQREAVYGMIGETLFNLPFYYGIELVLASVRKTRIENIWASAHWPTLLRAAQVLTGAVAVAGVVTGVAKKQAYDARDFKICTFDAAGADRERSFLVVDRSGDTFICALADVKKGWFFNKLQYFKVPDDGRPQTFGSIHLQPRCLRVEPVPAEGTVAPALDPSRAGNECPVLSHKI